VPEVSIVDESGGEIILGGPIRLRILEDGSHTAGRLAVVELTIAPHTDGPPQHRHGAHDEGFYVVSGTARFTVGAATYDAPPGTFVTVPPGAPHTFANPGEVPAVVLNTLTPDLYVQYFRDLRDLTAKDGSMSPDDLTAAMARYHTEPATTYADRPR
jgi:mannose-6-phosphate isomerase-like protein (cupin superfamily)